MAGKLEGIDIWKSSSTVLPEHIEALNRDSREQLRRPRKQLDDHELEQINYALQQSMLHRVPISIEMYDPFEVLRIVGVIEGISRQYGRFQVGDDWFSLEDIQAIHTEGQLY